MNSHRWSTGRLNSALAIASGGASMRGGLDFGGRPVRLSGLAMATNASLSRELLRKCIKESFFWCLKQPQLVQFQRQSRRVNWARLRARAVTARPFVRAHMTALTNGHLVASQGTSMSEGLTTLHSDSRYLLGCACFRQLRTRRHQEPISGALVLLDDHIRGYPVNHHPLSAHSSRKNEPGLNWTLDEAERVTPLKRQPLRPVV